MTISRRQFNRIVIWGGASFAASATSGIFFPKPAEAYSLEFPISALSADRVFNGIQKYCGAQPIPGVLSTILQGNTNVSNKVESAAANAIRRADKEFVDRNFTSKRTELGQVGKSEEDNTLSVSRLWGRQRQDQVGPNVGFGFVQKWEDQYSDTKISGPTMCAIHNAQQVLADQRLTPPQIAASLLPSRSRVDDDDWGSWGGDADASAGRNPGAVFAQYNTAAGTVTSRYDLVEPGPRGFGRVEYTIEAENQPRRVILVTVRF
ncbi:Tat pathway signal protein [Tychonema sp. LEGE 07199]|uniref:Tat pathway signal protein n=1 Tax=unclassified Tychonema TaxID=2642144 RepID=UPI00187DE65C|nr:MULTISPECIES: Tat pathway signal protein [unclassified Tychonema]MBE9119981.1 Tat pathway signal protein [Tychonema sp. LEGE 07199]MBE9132063.1 Tat pathway signal protein [Tychonema sp. LEGE 07196]